MPSAVLKEGIDNYTPPVFTVRNTVLLALSQTVVITLGVLVSATNRKVAGDILGEDLLSGLAALLAGQGVWLLVLPLAWVTATLALRQREDVRAGMKLAAFLSGIVLTLVLGAMFYEVVSQTWGQVCWGMGGDSMAGD